MPTNSEFQDVRFEKSKSAERGETNQGTAGEWGQAGPFAPDTPHVSATGEQAAYPNVFGYGMDQSNSQFSSDKASTPDQMIAESSRDAFYELQHFLNNSPYTIGSRVCHELKEVGKPAHGTASGPGNGKTGPA